VFYTLSALLEIMLVERADAVHLHPGEKPVVEVTRTLFQVSGPPIEPGDPDKLLRQIASKNEYREFQSAGFISCYHQVPGQGWFTFMAFREQNQIRLEIRVVR
jgi:Tfp pilus assembly pilus retraction ATPase PilT